MSNQRTTLADVASAAGVSVSTASLAYSGAGPIAEATRLRVLDAAERLGYSGPNPLGRQLRQGRAGIVGVVVGDALRRAFRDPVTGRMLDGLCAPLAAAGLGVLLIPGSDDPTAPHLTHPLLATAAMDAGIILWGGSYDGQSLATLRNRGIPVVLVEGGDVPGVSHVGVDDRGGMVELARHIVGLGHRRVAVVTLPFNRDGAAGPVDDERFAALQYDITRRRLAGVREVLEPVTIYETPASLVEHGSSAARTLLDVPADRRPTAILCQSDLLAAGAVLAARELGLRVPQDVSIAGFDGLDLAWLAPDVLTSVDQPLTEKGEAVGAAARDLAAGGEPTTQVLPVRLVVGTTTGPAPA